MKKFLIMSAAAVSLLGLAACNDNKDSGSAPAPSTNDTTTTPSTPAPTTPGTGGGTAPSN